MYKALKIYERNFSFQFETHNNNNKKKIHTFWKRPNMYADPKPKNNEYYTV